MPTCPRGAVRDPRRPVDARLHPDARPAACDARRPQRSTTGRGGPPLRSEQGQTTVVVAVLAGLVVLVLLGTARLGAAAVERAGARTAADAAALAAVGEEAGAVGSGRAAAVEIAARNGATVTAYRVDGTAVEVTVRVGDAHASARADRSIGSDP